MAKTTGRAASAPSHADFIDKLNAICSEAKGQAKRVQAAAYQNDYASLANAFPTGARRHRAR